MNANDLIHHHLQAFAEAVKAKTAVLVLGQPEEQLRAPFESFVVGALLENKPCSVNGASWFPSGKPSVTLGCIKVLGYGTFCLERGDYE